MSDQTINSYRDLLLAERVGILAVPDLHPVLGQCESLGKMLRALMRSLQEKAAN